MPSTTLDNENYVTELLEPKFPSLYENFGLDFAAEAYLVEDRGWVCRRGMLTPPLRSLDRDEVECMYYLVHEWDYGVTE